MTKLRLELEWCSECEQDTSSGAVWVRVKGIWIFAKRDYADCVAHFGDEAETQAIVDRGGEHLEAAKRWCMDWARGKLESLNEDFA